MLHGPRDVRLETEPDLVGDPAPGHIRTRTVATAVSAGTEMAAFTARDGVPFYGWPFESPSAMGYLNVGRVESVGHDVAAPDVGDLVYTFNPHREQLEAPANEPWWPVPAGLDPAVAAFAYLISLGAHGLRRAGLAPGERVAVVGLGAVGLGVVALARTFGSHVTAIDPVAFRRDLAGRLGADEAVEPAAASGVEADVVVEAAGSWPGVETAYAAARQQARVAIVALHPSGPAAGSPTFSPFGEAFYTKQLTVVSTSFQPAEDLAPHHVRFTRRRGVADILERLASGSLDFAPAVTHRIAVEELPGLYPRLEAGTTDAGAIAVTWDGP
jgi:threonine dehydrogenase-like Zn-dependent dehydrogenase